MLPFGNLSFHLDAPRESNRYILVRSDQQTIHLEDPGISHEVVTLDLREATGTVLPMAADSDFCPDLLLLPTLSKYLRHS